MKKQISIALLLGATLLASSAYAEVGEVSPGSAVTVGSTANGVALPAGVTLGCVTLSSAIKVGTSANVYGGYDCREATATTAAGVGVATCHLSGLKADVTYTCTGVDQPVAGCVAPVPPAPAATVTVTGGKAFYALTTGGSTQATPLGATACNAAGAMSAKATLMLDAGLAP